MKILGLISGTSHDGIDHAVGEFLPEGEGLTLQILSHGSTPYAPALREELLQALPPRPTTLAAVAELDTRIGQAFAAAAEQALQDAGTTAADTALVVSHGQTVYHWVESLDGAPAQVHGTLQIGQPAWIAEKTGLPVLSDVRIRDITAGGQGAPLASTLDALLLAGRLGTSAALNLGGISNVTLVSSSTTRAWDIGPANALIDAVITARQLHPEGYDDGGKIAASGKVDAELLELFLAEPYYDIAPPKTTGKELFHLDYVEHMLHRHEQQTGRSADQSISSADLIATLTQLTVSTLVQALNPAALSAQGFGDSEAGSAGLNELFVSGGGVHNQVIMQSLQRELPGTAVQTTNALGIGPDEKEAALMALLGWLTMHGVPATVPTATGAQGSRFLGSITPGASPLQLPQPQPTPAFLRMLRNETGPGNETTP